MRPNQKSEVDQRVAQELKNNQDFIYETNQKLQSLSEGIIALALQHEKIKGKSESDLKELHIAFENFRETILDSYKGMLQRLGESEQKVSEITKAFCKLETTLKASYITRDDFKSIVETLENKISAIEFDFKENHDYFNFCLDRIKGHFSNQIDSVKKDLTPVVPEIDPIKAQLDDRFKVFKVDFDGLVREISILKKSVAYDQKKFENIYTLIERLKEGKQ